MTNTQGWVDVYKKYIDAHRKHICEDRDDDAYMTIHDLMAEAIVTALTGDPTADQDIEHVHRLLSVAMEQSDTDQVYHDTHLVAMICYAINIAKLQAMDSQPAENTDDAASSRPHHHRPEVGTTDTESLYGRPAIIKNNAGYDMNAIIISHDDQPDGEVIVAMVPEQGAYDAVTYAYPLSEIDVQPVRLDTITDYESAPIGTIVSDKACFYHKSAANTWDTYAHLPIMVSDLSDKHMADSSRTVLRWGKSGVMWKR